MADPGAARGKGRPEMGYARPGTYEELRAVLASGTINLPRRLRQVAVHLLQHPTDVALGTITDVAAAAAVQPSTLVRFSQIFGFSGFSELQGLFKEHLKGTLPDPVGSRDPRLHFLTGLIAASQSSLHRIAADLDPARFQAMIAALAAADLIHVVGSKRAFPVATYIALTLAQQGVRNALVDNVGSTALDQIACVRPGDAVLAVSFSPYNSITRDLIAVAHERGATILTLTDSALCPLVGLSAVWLEVVEQTFGGFRPLAASLAVGMALVHGVAGQRQKAIDRPEASF